MSADAPATPKANNEHEELRVLYQACVSEIAAFKQQQWTVTNYAIAIYVAIVLVGKEFLGVSIANWQRIVLCALGVGACVGAWAVLHMLQSSIQVRRDRLDRVRSHFSKAFMAAWDQPKEADEVLLLLKTVLVAGLVLSAWLVSVEI